MWRDRRGAAAALAILLATAGCGPELLGGAQNEGEVRATATSDESGSSASRTIHAEEDGGPASTAASTGIQGEISVSAMVWLVTAEGDQVPLSAGVAPGTFRIEGDDESLIARADVDARTYTGVRILFTSVAAVVEGGLLINGAPIIGAVSVALPAGGVVIERPVQLAVEPRTTSTLVIDLNAHVWLPATTLPSRTVPAEAFRAAVEVGAR